MRIYEVISPHTPAELTYDYLQDPLDGKLTTQTIEIYNYINRLSNNQMLSASEQFSPDVIAEFVDDLQIMIQRGTLTFVTRTKAGKMLTEMIAYFEGR